jgi:hypothetical protein
MNDMQRREYNIPSKIILRQINVGWLKMIQCLKELFNKCDSIKEKGWIYFYKILI